ncbi:alpha/beta hydrolase [Endozoicomonas sp. OPT23]|uniref:alpha/beta hydrolase n=1 Tax=Endozoicomonas sp. OPT23 TaxID=2072845 RepID=UPI001891A0F8|nr:alpha/beta hydrolase [Endozoicomonas sp. OPT23]
MKQFSLQRQTHSIPFICWDTPDAKAVIHISHGMAEYARRYDLLAQQLNAAGFIVYAHDHRGHGDCIKTTGKGYFADDNGWQQVVGDLACVVGDIKTKHPNLPLILLGHSMGSYMLQSYLIEHQPEVAAAVFSGSNFAPALLLQLGKIVASLEVLRQGITGHSPIIKQLTFTSYNRRFKPNRTEFDWLSRDEEQVDLYANNPLCGFDCTNQLWKELFTGMLSNQKSANLSKIPSNLPVLVMGGEQDSVSYPKGQQNLTKALRNEGLSDVTMQLYPDGRHEMFNEVNAQQVVDRLIQWMNEKI